jgi:hypothetical protein
MGPSASDEPAPSKLMLVPSSTLVAELENIAIGASGTLLTVIVKVWLVELSPPFAVPPLSVAVTVMVAMPKALAAGV